MKLSKSATLFNKDATQRVRFHPIRNAVVPTFLFCCGYFYIYYPNSTFSLLNHRRWLLGSAVTVDKGCYNNCLVRLASRQVTRS